METKFSNMISRLKMRNASFFHMNVMTKTMATERVQGPFAYALEFPSTVVRAHATNFGVLDTFQRTTCDMTMPIEVTVKEKPGLKHESLHMPYMDLVAGKPLENDIGDSQPRQGGGKQGLPVDDFICDCQCPP